MNKRIGFIVSLAAVIALVVVFAAILLCLPKLVRPAVIETTCGAVRTATIVAVVSWQPDADSKQLDWTFADTTVHYVVQPITVTCKALYADPLPRGECYIFGSVVDSLTYRSYFDLNDGYEKNVRVCTGFRCKLEKGQFVRVRLVLEGKGQGTANEVLVLGFR
jgi:hypothetical protein